MSLSNISCWNKLHMLKCGAQHVGARFFTYFHNTFDKYKKRRPCFHEKKNKIEIEVMESLALNYYLIISTGTFGEKQGMTPLCQSNVCVPSSVGSLLSNDS